MSTSAGRSRSATGRGGSRSAAPSRRRAGNKSSSSAAARSDYRVHLVVTASVGGCLLVFNVTLFFCLYCRRRVRRHSTLPAPSLPYHNDDDDDDNNHHHHHHISFSGLGPLCKNDSPIVDRSKLSADAIAER